MTFFALCEKCFYICRRIHNSQNRTMKRLLLVLTCCISICCVSYAQSSAESRKARRESRKLERQESRKSRATKNQETQEVQQVQELPQENYDKPNVKEESISTLPDTEAKPIKQTPITSLETETEQVNEETNETEESESISLLWICAFVIALALYLLFRFFSALRRILGRCSNCGKYFAMEVFDEQHLGCSKSEIKKGLDGKIYTKHSNNVSVKSRCKHCGHIDVYTEER